MTSQGQGLSCSQVNGVAEQRELGRTACAKSLLQELHGGSPSDFLLGSYYLSTSSRSFGGSSTGVSVAFILPTPVLQPLLGVAVYLPEGYNRYPRRDRGGICSGSVVAKGPLLAGRLPGTCGSLSQREYG